MESRKPSDGGEAYYKKAAQYANEVYKSKKHDLNPDVYAMWKCMATDKYDTEYNESIWEVEFIGTRLDNNYTESRIGNTIGNAQRNGNATGKGYTYAFYAGTLVLWDLFEKNSTDKRRDLSMAPYYLNAKDVQVKWKDHEITMRRCGKFRREWETAENKNKNWTPENYPILRYADVLLMLAEAENEVNKQPTDLAYTAINLVRKRAGIPELKTCHTTSSNKNYVMNAPANFASSPYVSSIWYVGEFTWKECRIHWVRQQPTNAGTHRVKMKPRPTRPVANMTSPLL